MRARGASQNPSGRFEPLHYVDSAEEAFDNASRDFATTLLCDESRSIISTNDSPDLNFSASLNAYRGCEHGCIYCYARPGHEYLGLSAGRDFETKILVKERAPELLRRKLGARAWKPQVIAMSGVTDPYQPAERRLRITRRCLEVLAEFRNPVGILTKSWLITRDLDLLQELARWGCVSVMLSITSLDPALQQRMEPRAAHPAMRLRAIEALARAEVPVGVMVAPVIPGLTDHETPDILRAAADAGASHAGRVLLRLPHGLTTLFETWLEEHYPERRAKVLNQLRSLRGGKLYDSRWRHRHRGNGPLADHLQDFFALWRRRSGMRAQGPRLSTRHFRRPRAQLELFDGAVAR